MRILYLYKKAVLELDAAGIENPEIDSALLIEYCFNVTRSQLILADNSEVSEEEATLFQNLLKRRLRREPLQYITGKQEFWSLDFIVNEDVLVPRQETEFLLHHIISFFSSTYFSGGPVLDMCTGSGVIAIVLALEINPSLVLAVDKSFDALLIAKKNSINLTKCDTVQFLCSDLFSALNRNELFEVIVANPPYIPDGEISQLQPEVSKWEPRIALSGGTDGLFYIEKIGIMSLDYLRQGGWLFMEIGAEQGESAFELFSEITYNDKSFSNIKIIPDWSGRSRVLQAQKAN